MQNVCKSSFGDQSHAESERCQTLLTLERRVEQQPKLGRKQPTSSLASSQTYTKLQIAFELNSGRHLPVLDYRKSSVGGYAKV